MTRHVLGVDAGGTKTVAAVADEDGNVLGVGASGPGNADGAGVEAVGRSLREAVGAARQSAGGVTIDAGFVGAAGVLLERDRVRTRAMLEPELEDAVASVEVDHDGRGALAGALSGRPGLLLIAGTGSFCFGRDQAGHEAHASGWGSLFGDEGSAYWVAVEGVRAALAGQDGRGEPTSLGDVLFGRLGVTGGEELLSRTGTGAWSRSEIAGLAPFVVGEAEAGDAAAAGVVRRGVAELARAARAVSGRLGFGGPVEIAGTGGLFNSRYVWDALVAQLAVTLPPATLVRPELPPVLGSVLVAVAGLRSVTPAELPAGVLSALRQAAATHRAL